jgi:hypothetical protein
VGVQVPLSAPNKLKKLRATRTRVARSILGHCSGFCSGFENRYFDMKRLFTERYGAGKPRTKEQLDDNSRYGLWNFLVSRIDEEWFGLAFPSPCADGYLYAGTSTLRLAENMAAYNLVFPKRGTGEDAAIPSDGEIFDVIEFLYEHVAEPTQPHFHSYMQHTHYSYDQESGRGKFADDVNRIFGRNGIAYNLEHGEIVRIAPAVLHESLGAAVFHTSDDPLDELLEASRRKFLDRSFDVRREALEKLWDAWERLKTVEPGRDKRAQATALLDRAAGEPNFRERLETEARALTEIGNRFMIRHTEMDKVPIADSAHVDYLFQRMFALIRLLLKASGRGG